ncbi:redox-sensing transcriptional repressor Rex, partial [Klebsiella pneumoniae]
LTNELQTLIYFLHSGNVLTTDQPENHETTESE